MAKLSPREKAQATALRGDVESAVALLTSLQEQGDTAARASLAEISAFGGQWEAAMQHAAAVVADPTSIETLNVYQDMLRLIALAGMHLERWAEVQRIAAVALEALGRVDLLEAHTGAAAGLARFGAAKGQVSDGWRPGRCDDRPEQERRAKYDAGIAKLSKDKKRFKTPQARHNHYVSMAKNGTLYDAAVSLYDEGGLPELFDAVVFVASGLARAGRPDEAWAAIRSRLGTWWPVAFTQIAPVELLADDALRPLMTPERYDEVLRTPRGPQAAA
jgi:hypothetical protein